MEFKEIYLTFSLKFIIEILLAQLLVKFVSYFRDSSGCMALDHYSYLLGLKLWNYSQSSHYFQKGYYL